MIIVIVLFINSKRKLDSNSFLVVIFKKSLTISAAGINAKLHVLEACTIGGRQRFSLQSSILRSGRINSENSVAVAEIYVMLLDSCSIATCVKLLSILPLSSIKQTLAVDQA